ncbi:MAG: hypothetical protein KC589_06805 [Nanoarchaeota archaeon]|nr:hypothetical protein [Nanoarchaeota archaeon]
METDIASILEELKKINNMEIKLEEVTYILNLLATLFEKDSRTADVCYALSKAFSSSNANHGYKEFIKLIKEEVSFQRGVLEHIEASIKSYKGKEEINYKKVLESQKLILSIFNRLRVFVSN